ncbi:hypothetical protein [Desulfovibrio desulfuricans]|uniref:hypothetical protein n=1 Tax=Desulfovibrio desulfuricans TaxID=876 RepID=UPI0003B617E5|nr:hypothetical protein [Desulfovibrio desulfuricans]MDD3683268.1 peptidoglycan glycosyltransferase [Desulfovibrio desulfuricans]QTO41062.1 peptidoglycan glycosyltransferase [Desulfovibrio desulfuricans]
MTKDVWFLRIYAAICLVLAGALFTGAASAAHIAKPGPEPQILTIVNATGEDILSMGFQTGRSMHFVRFDMPPAGRDDIENPGAVAYLRVDTGLALWIFKDVPLAKAQSVTLRMGEKPLLELAFSKGEQQRLTGETQSLLPGPDAGPVCALDRFRPGMPMKDVCTLLSATPQRDDNDAVLASLGFAGMVWAARLEPAQRGEKPSSKTPLVLDHMELRRKLDQETLDKLLSALYEQKYSPWQAELPGLDINFTQMPSMDLNKQKDMLRQVLEYFMSASKGEATIMLAPTEMLPKLADADAPSSDVQLFTITLRPASKNLVVDVAAYQESEESR